MESNNKKIKGATSIEYNGIKFKSILECSCYKKLEAAGFEVEKIYGDYMKNSISENTNKAIVWARKK